MLIAAGIGVATNEITGQWSWTWGSGLVALVVGGVAIQMRLTLTEERKDSGAPPSDQVTPALMRATSTGTARDSNIFQGNTFGITGRHLVSLFAVLALVLLLVMVAVLVHSDVKQPHAVPSQKSVAGYPLRLTITGVDNTCSRVVLPEEVKASAAKFLKVTEQPPDPRAFMRGELDLGGYAHDEIAIRFNAQTPLPQQVTITDVRIVELVQADSVRGAFVNLNTCGGDQVNAMVIHVDGPDRRPFFMDEYGNETSRRFFDVEIVNVAPGKKQSFVVRVRVTPGRSAGSFTFRLAIDYEVDGLKASTVVGDGKQPFRLTGGCDWTTVTTAWGTMNELMREVDPEEFAHQMCD
ncbi:hypothetical protein [Sphaerisporangium aureirubrum]|uniref:Uncharacterized protein n=1 Tax=Sphaerisporangium aureirubrum TaxID=1544736 RepID=A0ABW1NWV3_9ACTN